MQEILDIQILQFFKLERFSVVLSNIPTCAKEAFQILCEMQQLLIFFIIIEWNDRYAILKLIAKRVDSVIYYNNVFQSPKWLKYSEVLDIHPTLCCPDAALSI